MQYVFCLKTSSSLHLAVVGTLGKETRSVWTMEIKLISVSKKIP